MVIAAVYQPLAMSSLKIVLSALLRVYR